MWSRRFLWSGLWSGAAIAAATFALMWLGMLAISGQGRVSFVIANISLLGLGGIVAYPACWYVLIFRAGSYSGPRVAWLTALTFIASSALAAIPFVAWAAYAKASPLLALRFVAMGMIVMVISYAVVATPMAFWHRHLLRGWFAAAPAVDTAAEPQPRGS